MRPALWPALWTGASLGKFGRAPTTCRTFISRRPSLALCCTHGLRQWTAHDHAGNRGYRYRAPLPHHPQHFPKCRYACAVKREERCRIGQRADDNFDDQRGIRWHSAKEYTVDGHHYACHDQTPTTRRPERNEILPWRELD